MATPKEPQELGSWTKDHCRTAAAVKAATRKRVGRTHWQRMQGAEEVETNILDGLAANCQPRELKSDNLAVPPAGAAKAILEQFQLVEEQDAYIWEPTDPGRTAQAVNMDASLPLFFRPRIHQATGKRGGRAAR